MLDNSKFVGAVVGAKQLGFDAGVIVKKISNLAKLETDQKALEEKVEFLDKKRDDLEQKCSYLAQEELIHTHRISLYHELEKRGMGIKELKLLWHIVAEIAIANNISQDRASQKFLTDVQQQYDDKLGFEAMLQNLKSEILKNEQMQLQIVAITAMLNSIILMQFDQIQQVSGFVEFGPLVKAAKGQQVPINQLKSGVIKAIDILITSDSTDCSTTILKTTKSLLQKDIQESNDIV